MLGVRQEVPHALLLGLADQRAHVEVHGGRADAQVGKRPAQAPEYSVSFGLDSTWRKFALAADLTFDGEAFEDDLNTLPLKPSRRLNLRADYAVTQHVMLYADLGNALNDRVQIARTGDGTVSYDNRRMLSIGVRFIQ